jgi:hypothetical protein
MKRAISILCSLLLIFQGNIVHAEQQPCDVVGYMVLWDIPLYEEVLNEKWTKDSTVLPFYMGALCIDNKNKKITFYKKHEDFPWNYKITGELADLNIPTTVIMISYHPEIGGREEVSGSLGRYFARKNTERFPEYVLMYYGEHGIEVIRQETNAVPDMNWEPDFRHKFTFRELQKHPREYYSNISEIIEDFTTKEKTGDDNLKK